MTDMTKLATSNEKSRQLSIIAGVGIVWSHPKWLRSQTKGAMACGLGP